MPHADILWQYAFRYPLLVLLALMWTGFLFDRLTFKLFRPILGIRPRRFLSLPAMFTAPLLHVDFTHLLSNSIPLALMGFLSGDLLPLPQFFLLLLIATCGSGLGVWLFGRNAIMLGASGLVFAFFGFLLAYAWWTRDRQALYYAIAAFVLYGGLLLSLLKHQPQVSWAAHLWGFLSGIGAAWWIAHHAVLK
ncbi:MAG: rhomboid family intramembrane serine protease [Cardiobacteriaceae bacterium]|nr:rhomboid family intramembrane serine protease [Cardiobacteriaceae bacterium]